MIPTNITKQHVKLAFQKAEKESYPKNRASTHYEVRYKNASFPPKVILSYANLFANGKELDRKAFHGGKETNNFLKELGFSVRPKMDSDFFTKKDVEVFEEYGGQPYDSTSKDHKAAGKYIKQHLLGKTRKWADLVADELGMEVVSVTRSWNNVSKGPTGQIFRNYTWCRLVDKTIGYQPVYFTVGVAIAKGKAFLEFKMDCENKHKNETMNLEDTEIDAFKKLKNSLGIKKQEISLSEIQDLNWTILIDTTTAWIEQQYHNYHFIIAQLFQSLPKKMARICWNSHSWTQPSGPEGKSKDKSYEKANGFCFEEWLFDTDKEIDGFHYGRIEPFARSKQNIDFYHLHLFSRNGKAKEAQMVAEVACAEKISAAHSKAIYEIYKKKGWWAQMRQQVEHTPGADVHAFDAFQPEDFFNVRFKVDSWTALDDIFFHPKSYRYKLLNLPDQLQLQAPEVQPSGSDGVNTEGHTRNTRARQIEYNNLHGKIQQAFSEYLSKQGHAITVEMKNKLNHSRVDIKAIEDGKKVYYEVKSYQNARTNIRMALGQLLEYAYYHPEPAPDVLKVVSHMKASAEDAAYLKELRKQSGIEVYHVQFDYKTEMVLQEI